MLSYLKTTAKYEISNQPGPLQETTFLPDTVFIRFEEFQTKRWLAPYTKTLKSDVAGGRKEGRVVRSPQAAGSKAAKWMIRERNWLSELNKFWITEPNKRKLNEMSWLFVKFIISAGGGHCDYSSRTLEDLVKPLILLVYLHRAFHCNSRENIKFHRQAHTALIYMAHFLPLVYYKIDYSYKLFYFTDQKFVRFFIKKLKWSRYRPGVA